MYKEKISDLSCACPPGSAVLPTLHRGYRLVKNIPATDDDFKSHAALGKIKPLDIDECSWSSCSLSNSVDKLINLKGLPKIKDSKAILGINLDISSGPIETNDKGHINWWPYDSFNIHQNSDVEEVF